MGVITIDKLGARTWARLEERARAHSHSVSEEAAAILESVVGGGKMTSEERLAFADEIAARTPKGATQDDSTAFIRAERDRMQ
jgi:plasmid stability protein